MEPTNKKHEYDIGYKKPPKDHQFKKGQSGNPKGRPKLIKNFEDDLREETEETLTIIENGKKIKITKQRAFIKRLTTLALSGDKALMKILSSLLSQLPVKVEDIVEEISIEDKKILDSYLANKGVKND